MSLVSGVDVRLLKDDANSGSLLGVSAGKLAVHSVIPVVVLLGILEHARSQGVPNAKIRKEDLQESSQ